MENVDQVIGATISDIYTDDNKLVINFSDGRKITFTDSADCCCEHRYMQTDDNVLSYIGSSFLGAELNPGPDMPDEEDNCHETEFLDIKTSSGVLQICNHNEHNGYYGGFSITATVN